MPTSLKTLREYRARHAGGPPSQQVWFFHSHAYFDETVPERVEEALAFRKRIEETFASNPHVEVHSFVPRPAGPHPHGSFEVLFTREAFAEYISWLAFERPAEMAILIHPLTRSQTLDHSTRAMWLGTPLTLDIAMLQGVDERLAASGRSEESIIDGTKKH